MGGSARPAEPNVARLGELLRLRDAAMAYRAVDNHVYDARAAFPEAAAQGAVARHPSVLDEAVFGELGVFRLPPCPSGRRCREPAVKPVGKPDAGNPHVRFDERGWETGRRSASAPAPILDSTHDWTLLGGMPEGRGFTGCGKTRLACHSEEPQATRNLALP